MQNVQSLVVLFQGVDAGKTLLEPYSFLHQVDQ